MASSSNAPRNSSSKATAESSISSGAVSSRQETSERARKSGMTVLPIVFRMGAYRVDRLAQQLAKAIRRGVSVTLIFESEAESEGQLTKDAAAAFQELPQKQVRIYYWPLAKRGRNPAGRPGKLHVKCAVIDDTALIGSANLTDDAVNHNMELGVLIRERATVHAIEHHFDELIRQGCFVQLPAGSTNR